MDAGRFISAMQGRDAAEQGFVYERSYLSEEYAKGRVKKTLLYTAEPQETEEITEIALLELEPGAEILEHKHTVDMEYYIINGKVYPCERGETHGYKNTTNQKVQIASVKFSVIV